MLCLISPTCLFCFVVFIARVKLHSDILSYTRKSSRTKALNLEVFCTTRPFISTSPLTSTPQQARKRPALQFALFTTGNDRFHLPAVLLCTPSAACCFYPWPVHLLWLGTCLLWKKVQHYNSPTKLLYTGAQPMCRLSSEIASALFLSLAFVPLWLGPCDTDTDIRSTHPHEGSNDEDPQTGEKPAGMKQTVHFSWTQFVWAARQIGHQWKARIHL